MESQTVFQAETQAKMFSIESPPRLLARLHYVVSLVQDDDAAVEAEVECGADGGVEEVVVRHEDDVGVGGVVAGLEVGDSIGKNLA